MTVEEKVPNERPTSRGEHQPTSLKVVPLGYCRRGRDCKLPLKSVSGRSCKKGHKLEPCAGGNYYCPKCDWHYFFIEDSKYYKPEQLELFDAKQSNCEHRR